jgi:polysaccharide pyruvyl transferase WcaK-like protein
MSAMVMLVPKKVLRAAAQQRRIPFSVTLRAFIEADSAVAVGGGYLGDQYRGETLLAGWTWWFVSRLCELVTMPMSFEVETTILSRVFGRLTRRVHLHVRDSESLWRAHRAGVASSSYVPDLAFLNAGARRGVSLSPSVRLAIAPVGNDYLSREELLHFVDAVCSVVISNGRIEQVSLIVMHNAIAATTIGSDGVAADALAARLKELGVAVEVKSTSRYIEVLDAMAAADFALCARMHAGIAALCVGTPVGLLAYERKHFALARDLGMTGMVADVRCSSDELEELFSRLSRVSRDDVLQSALGRRELVEQKFGLSQ